MDHRKHAIPSSVIFFNPFDFYFVAGMRMTLKKHRVKSNAGLLLLMHLVALVSVRAIHNSLVWFYMRIYLTLMHIAPASITCMVRFYDVEIFALVFFSWFCHC